MFGLLILKICNIFALWERNRKGQSSIWNWKADIIITVISKHYVTVIAKMK